MFGEAEDGYGGSISTITHFNKKNGFQVKSPIMFSGCDCEFMANEQGLWPFSALGS